MDAPAETRGPAETTRSATSSSTSTTSPSSADERHQQMKRAFASGAVAALLFAGANPACTVTMRAGSHLDGASTYRTVRAQDAGFSLDVPEAWVALNLTGKQPEETL